MRFLATVLLLAGVALSAQDAPKQDAPKKGGGGPPKNLKVLKPEEVRGMMGGMMGALGQRCNFCHVQGDNASDENPKKLVARKMMEMVHHVNEMLGADAKVKVTCYTCHRGKNIPESAPPPAAPAGQ
jgi:photosynthetic reaction center cytochrome c subunit